MILVVVQEPIQVIKFHGLMHQTQRMCIKNDDKFMVFL